MRTAITTTLLLAATVLAPAAAAGQAERFETTVEAPARGRLELHNGDGSVTIDTWNRESVRVVARRPSGLPIEVQRKGVAVVVRAPRQMERRASVDYAVTVPRSMDLEIHGMNSPVTIEGTEGRVDVHTIKGNIAVRGGREQVGLHTVNGSVSVVGARASVEVNVVNQAVSLGDVIGTSVGINAVNGAVRLDGVDARRVEVTTVNGKIAFDGSIHPDGVYDLNAHNGGIDMTIPSDASARIQVSTHNGTLHVGFPVTIEEGPIGKRFDFTLGAGRARIELTSFNGTIELRRPGS
ncbi:MAG: DUF4097 domain-containing protein [Gemmatimonadetes bacterium]|nr:DUF4097 domain-containing protein [Gemmatimonadota bacterium]